VLAALLMLGAAVFLIGDKQLLFHRTYRLNAGFKNAAGLANGAGVRVAGIQKGTVKRIDLPNGPEGQVVVEMNMDEATRRVIKKDSTASISSEGLVGDRYVEISMGSEKAGPIQEGDTLQGEPSLQLADLMKKANDILDNAQGAIQDAGVMVGNLKSISGKINQGTGTVGALINDRSLFQRVNAGTMAFQENMEALKHNFLTRGFFKNRGYEDAADLNKHAIAQLPKQPYSQKFTYQAGKIFNKPDSAKLKNKKALDEVGQYLEANPLGLVVVSAYAGMKGDTEELRKSTEAQAMVIRDYLASNFNVDDTRIRTQGLGKTARIPEGNQVEIYVYSKSFSARSAR
jgi:phospholipid/cholesterol/gamma-HCH transport system substrate-binding protein